MHKSPVTLNNPEEYFHLLDRSSRNHWWGRSIERIERRWSQRNLRRLPAYNINTLRWLDAGCGSGARLVEWSCWNCWVEQVGIEPELKGPKTIDIHSEKAIHLSHGTLPDIDFEADRFDFISSLDVIQHVPVNDRANAIRNMARALAPYGLILIRTNGAGLQFNSNTDKTVIDANWLNITLMQSGLRIIKASHFNMIGGIVEDCISIFRQKQHRPDTPKKHGLPSAWHTRPRGSWVGAMVGWAESQIVANGLVNLPIGHSYIVLAKKDLPHG